MITCGYEGGDGCVFFVMGGTGTIGSAVVRDEESDPQHCEAITENEHTTSPQDG
jgi:hypothetical protein